MKITFVFDGLTMGGIERVGINYCKLLKKMGHQVSVINLQPHKDDLENEMKEQSEIYYFSYHRKMIYQRYVKLTEYGILGAYSYAFICFFLCVFMIIKKMYARLKFRRLNDTDLLVAFSGHFNDLSFVGKRFIKTKKKIAWLHGAQFSYKMDSEGFFSLYKSIKNLVCLSEFADASCQKFNTANNIKKYKIYNPIFWGERKTDGKKIEKLQKQYGKFLLMVGRLEDDKDQITAIRAVQYLKEKYGCDFRLLLVGGGSKEEYLQSYIKENHLESNVYLTGQCSDVQNYYEAAYIYVHSSPMEGLPTVLLEAMMHKLPIAATDSIPGVREILGNNECGLLAQVNNSKDLGEKIYLLYNDMDLRNQMVERGCERIKDFLPDAIERKLSGMLQNID